MNYLDANKNYINRFHYTDCCDELIFATVLKPVENQLNIDTNNSLRYIAWFERGLPHIEANKLNAPLILDERDFKDICQSNCLFCRKVESEKSENLLELLDEYKVGEHCIENV